MKRILLWLFVFTLAGRSIGAAERSHYWEWGWGLYGSGLGLLTDVADVARFDWNVITFGNEAADQSMVDWCNKILQANPKHKFVIRVWSTTGRTCFMDYFYKPGVREQVLASTKRQVELIVKGVTKPENVVGAFFLEELPDHCSQFMDGDVALYPKEIAAELGAPFDKANEKHREWYGRKWVKFIDEINQTMKDAGRGLVVIYYQSTMYGGLDDYDAWTESGKGVYGSGKAPVKADYLPYHCADIVKPGYCDGIFGYPRVAWGDRTERVVKKLNCFLFSQISLPRGMRSFSLADTIKVARWENPGNLGAFLYGEEGRKDKGPRELPYQDDTTYWTLTDHMRRFGWDNKVGLDVVARCLAPAVDIDYSVQGLKRGQTARVQALVHNRRHPSWYGGDAGLATLNNVRATLSVPRGFSIVPPGGTADFGSLDPDAYRAVAWTVRLDKSDSTIPAGQAFRVLITADTADGGTKGTAESSLVDKAVPSLETRYAGRSGDTWAEPAFRLSASPMAVELQPLYADIDSPELVRGDGQRVIYHDVLRPNSLLRIGPGQKATLLAPYLEESVRRFGVTGPDKLATIDAGYFFYRIGLAVRSKEQYRIRITGKANDGNIMIILGFSGMRDGKTATESLGPVIYGGLTGELKTIESKPVDVPQFDNGSATLSLMFYRIASKGTLQLKEFECVLVGVPETGTDVSSKVEGTVPDVVTPFSIWTYKDKSDPVRYHSRKVRVQFSASAPIQ